MNISALKLAALALVAGLSLAVGLGAVSSALGQQGKTQAEVSERITGALITLHQQNQGEIELARLAVDKASSPPIRDFARTLVEDHQRVDAQLEQLAGDLGINLQREASARPDPRGPTMQKTLAGLREASGERFDRLFLQAVIADHQQVISTLELGQLVVDNAQVTALTEKLLPSLREHLQRAEALKGQLDAG